MSTVHRWAGFGVVALFGVLWVWGLGARLFRRDPGRWFWHAVAGVQVVTGLQAIAGTILLVSGFSRPLLHYLYGAVFPIGVLLVAHVVARRFERDQWVPFAWAAFFSFGLTLRALGTGLGTG